MNGLNIQGTSPAQLYPEQADKACYGNHSEEEALAEVRRMLVLLGRQDDPDSSVHLRAIHPVTKKARSLTLAEFKRAFSLNKNGWNLYLAINRGGNSRAEITECCSNFFEYDDRTREEQLEIWKERGLLEPTFQIDTGGKSLHQYLVLDQPLQKDQWEELQRRLLARMENSDQNLKDPCRVMNCAGSFKYASQKHVELGLAEEAGELMGISQIISSKGTTYSFAELEAVLPALETDSSLSKSFPKPQKDLSDAEQEHNKDKALVALKCLPAADFEDYPSWLKVGMALHSVDEGLLNDWVEWSRPMSNFDEEECLQKWTSFSEKEPGEGIGLGSLIEQAKKYGYKTSTRSASVVASEVITWTAYLDQILRSIQDHDKDTEMQLRSQMMCDFRAAEAKINQALLKRFSGSKAIKVKAKHSSVRLCDVEMLDYYMDGWIIKGDIQLLYAPAGVGKTTLALRKCFALAKGENILDRDARCTPAKSLFIATDSGAAALVKAISDLGINPDDPLINPGPNQMIYIWAYEPDQGHDSWICDINGVVRLEDFIKANDIAYVACDSAKSVSSLAGWSYTDNTDVKTMLTHLRQCVCKPTGACIEFISHDGSKEGAHSGAKAWSEEPSMVCSLTPALNQDQRQVGVTAQFIKDRAATVDPRRSFVYHLDPDQNELVALAGTTVVSNCAEAVIDVLWRFHQAERIDTSISSLINECLTKHNKTDKTVRNTLGTLTKGKSPRVIKKRRGYYALSPGEIQRQNQIPPSPPQSGGHRPKPFTTTNKNECPNQYPDGSTGINTTGSPACPNQHRDKALGQSHYPGAAMDLGAHPPKVNGRRVSQDVIDRPRRKSRQFLPTAGPDPENPLAGFGRSRLASDDESLKWTPEESNDEGFRLEDETRPPVDWDELL